MTKNNYSDHFTGNAFVVFKSSIIAEKVLAFENSRR